MSTSRVKHFVTPLLFLAFFLLPTSVAFAEETKTAPLSETASVLQEVPIELFADEITHSNKKDEVVAIGKVQIKYLDRFLFADKVVMNTKTGFGEATGNVYYKDGLEEIKCKSAKFNVEKKEGILFDAQAFIQNQYNIKGKEFERYDENRFRAVEATITTCDGPFPFWSICSQDVDGEREGFMTMKHSTFNIKGIPVLYLPYWYASVVSKRKSGFLMPEFQYSNIDGSSVKIPYFWAVNKSHDVTFYMSHLSKKGFKPELEYRYILDKQSKGKVRGLYLKENDTKRTFWELRYTHSQRFEDNMRFFASGFLQDKSNSYAREFGVVQGEQSERRSRADANFSKEWDDFSFLAKLSYVQSLLLNSDQSLVNLPKLRFLTYQQRIGETPFYFSFDSSLNYIEEGRNGNRNVSRSLDLRPSLLFQQSFFPWLNASASITGLTTFYQQSQQLKGAARSKISFVRKLYHLNGTLRGPALSKKYDDSFKHTVQPFLEYNFIPNLDQADRRRIKIYDVRDALGNQNKFTYGLNNSVIGYFKKRTGRNSENPEDDEIIYEPKKILGLLIQQSYRVDNLPNQKVSPFDNFYSDIEYNGIANYFVSNSSEKKFSNVYGKLDLYLANGITMVSDVEVSSKGLDKYNVSLQRAVEGNILLISKRYNRAYNNYWNLEVSQELFKKWRFHYQNGYSEFDKKILYHYGSLEYQEDCWGVTLSFLRKSAVINRVIKDSDRIILLLNFVGLGSVGKQN